MCSLADNEDNFNVGELSNFLQGTRLLENPKGTGYGSSEDLDGIFQRVDYGNNEDYMRISGTSISLGDLRDLASLDGINDDEDDEDETYDKKTSANEYEKNINQLLITTTKEKEGGMRDSSSAITSDESNIQEEMGIMRIGTESDLVDFKIDDVFAEIDNISIGGVVDGNDGLMQSNVKFTDSIFSDDDDEVDHDQNKNDDVIMTSLTNSLNSASISKKNMYHIKQSADADSVASYDDRKPAAASPQEQKQGTPSPAHQTKTVAATNEASQQQQHPQEYQQQKRGSAKDKDLISFQCNLNGKLEELVQSMKRTEESRHMLARHTCRRNSMGSPGLTAYNIYRNEQQQSQQQSFHQSFTAQPPQSQPQPPQYQQYNNNAYSNVQQQYVYNDPNIQQQQQTHAKYETPHSDGQYNNCDYGYEQQQQHQYAYNHPPQAPVRQSGRAMRRQSMY